jgi:F-type H+-transporting ATPase subunit b
MLYTPSAYAGGGPIPASVNLILFLVVIVALARKPVSKMLELRASTIKRSLSEAQEKLKEAQKRNDEVESQLKSLEQQLSDMRGNAQEQIESMRQEMNVKAERDVLAIHEGAKKAVENELKRAREQLKKETALAAVELAEEILKQQINPQDQQQLFSRFNKAVEGSSHV